MGYPIIWYDIVIDTLTMTFGQAWYEYNVHYNSVDKLNLNNINLENNQNIQYIKHSKYRQDSETSNYGFYKSVS
jgi:hypothetical protein